MGLAYPASELVILNGGFDNADHWTLDHPWTIAGGLLIDNQTLALHNPAKQFPIAFIIGNLYKITFTLLNPAFTNGDAGVIVDVAGGRSAPIRIADTYTVLLEATLATQTFAFEIFNNAIGDYCEIDNVSVTTPSDTPIDDLKIFLPNNLLFEIDEGVNTDFWARYCSLNGRSRILIAWNEP